MTSKMVVHRVALVSSSAPVNDALLSNQSVQVVLCSPTFTHLFEFLDSKDTGSQLDALVIAHDETRCHLRRLFARLKERSLDVPLVLVGSPFSLSAVSEATQLQIFAHLPEAFEPEDLRHAISSAALRCIWFSHDLINANRSNSELNVPLLADSLTEREEQVLRLLVERNTYQDISHNLGISRETVKCHVRKLMGKLGVSNRTELVMLALAAS